MHVTGQVGSPRGVGPYAAVDEPGGVAFRGCGRRRFLRGPFRGTVPALDAGVGNNVVAVVVCVFVVVVGYN